MRRESHDRPGRAWRLAEGSRRGETQLPLWTKPSIHPPKRVAIDPQPHHLDTFAKARRAAKVIGNLGVYTVGGEGRQVKPFPKFQRGRHTRQTPERRKADEQRGSTGPGSTGNATP